MADKTEKCAHPACRCIAEPGSKYCSTSCEEMASTTVTHCPCGHAGCVTTATAGSLPTA
jgi:hypothetical protein